jgi:hypothetical protein
VDVTIDKAGAFIALPILVSHGLFPQDQALSIGVRNIGNGIAAATAKSRNIEIHPSRGGKDAVMAEWMSIGLNSLGRALKEEHNLNTPLMETAANLCFHAAMGLGIAATREYAHDALR